MSALLNESLNDNISRAGISYVKIPSEMPDVLFASVVKGRQSQANVWTETVDVISASASGLGFYSIHECFVGQVLSFMMPMPTELRRYDQDKKFYKIWGLVQHCHSLVENDSYHVGVAFIGSLPPPSYPLAPQTSYRVSGIGSDGFWCVSEAERPFTPRRHTRFHGTIEGNISTLNADGSDLGNEKVFTENICETGAAIFSNLPLDVGEQVRFSSSKFEFETTAMVRNRQEGKDGRARLHLEFIDSIFPISQLTGSR